MKSQEIKFKSKNHKYLIFIGKNTLSVLPKKLNYYPEYKKYSTGDR